MRSFLAWVGKGLPWIFSLLGIAATVYFSAFYIPDYLAEVKNERVRAVNRDLIETVQELVYNGKELDTTFLINLVDGKELTYDVVYPYSLEELLLQVRDGFVSSKYLPLDKRDSLSATLDGFVATLRSSARATVDTLAANGPEEASHARGFPAYASIAAGLIGAILGLITVFLKLRAEKTEEVERSVDDRKEEVERHVTAGWRYEQKVREVLEDLGITIVDQVAMYDSFNTDFAIDIHNRRYHVSCKLVQRGFIGKDHFERLGRISVNFNEPTIMVTNCSLTKSNKEWLSTFDHRGDLAQVHVVHGYYSEELREAFKQFLVDQSPPSDS